MALLLDSLYFRCWQSPRVWRVPSRILLRGAAETIEVAAAVGGVTIGGLHLTNLRICVYTLHLRNE